jgi:hypothetical protein
MMSFSGLKVCILLQHFPLLFFLLWLRGAMLRLVSTLSPFYVHVTFYWACSFGQRCVIFRNPEVRRSSTLGEMGRRPSEMASLG